MGQIIKLDDREYDIDSMNDRAKATVLDIQFVNARIQELNNMQAILRRAQNSYIKSLKIGLSSVFGKLSRSFESRLPDASN